MSQRARRPNPFSRLGELFDASAIGLITLLLVGLSFFATWRGMRDFIIGNDIAAGLATQALVLAIVLTLTLAMYVALRELISPYFTPNWWAHVWKRVIAFLLYALLAIWSVGFGYGFWWSVIAGQGVTETELVRSVTTLREDTSDVRARLAAAGAVMASAEALSDQKAQNEAERGGTCGIASPPGDGPLARARQETQSQIAAISATVQADWLPAITSRLDALDTSLQSVRDMTETDAAVRKSAFERVYSDARLSAREISSDATARGRTIAAQLRSKAEQLSVPPENGRVAYCYDPDLAANLIAAADEIDQTFEITVPEFRFSEGPEGVARAVEDLWGTVLAPLGVPVARVNAGPPTGRSLIALIATIGVDFGLLVFALLRGRETAGRSDRDGVIEGGRGSTGEEVQKRIEETAKPPVKALPKPEIPETPPVDENSGATEPFGPGDVRDAEYTDRHSPPAPLKTFEPDSQLSEEEQLAELLRAARVHLQEVQAAGSEVSRSKARNRLNDVLRKLKSVDHVATGMDDRQYQPELHHVVGAEPSDLPSGQIVRVVRPRFMSPSGQLLIPALVIVSKG